MREPHRKADIMSKLTKEQQQTLQAIKANNPAEADDSDSGIDYEEYKAKSSRISRGRSNLGAPNTNSASIAAFHPNFPHVAASAWYPYQGEVHSSEDSLSEGESGLQNTHHDSPNNSNFNSNSTSTSSSVIRQIDPRFAVIANMKDINIQHHSASLNNPALAKAVKAGPQLLPQAAETNRNSSAASNGLDLLNEVISSKPAKVKDIRISKPVPIRAPNSPKTSPNNQPITPLHNAPMLPTSALSSMPTPVDTSISQQYLNLAPQLTPLSSPPPALYSTNINPMLFYQQSNMIMSANLPLMNKMASDNAVYSGVKRANVMYYNPTTPLTPTTPSAGNYPQYLLQAQAQADYAAAAANAAYYNQLMKRARSS
jgi:hypothetical protein